MIALRVTFVLLFFVALSRAQIMLSCEVGLNRCLDDSQCNSNDVKLLSGEALNETTLLPLTNVFCNEGDIIPLKFRFVISGPGSDRDNVGIYLGVNGVPPTNSQVSPDANCTKCWIPGTLSCGDFEFSASSTQTGIMDAEVLCTTANNNDGFLRIFYCQSGQTSVRPCASIDQVVPSPGSKCGCPDDPVIITNVRVGVGDVTITSQGAPTCFEAGTVITFTDTVCNTGDAVTLLNVQLATTKPTSSGVVSFPSIAPGDCESHDFMYSITAGDVTAGSATHTVSAVVGACSPLPCTIPTADLASTTVFRQPLLAGTPSITQPTCPDSTNGIAVIQVSNGVPPLTISPSGSCSGSTCTVVGLGVGLQEFTIEDSSAGSCPLEVSLTLEAAPCNDESACTTDTCTANKCTHTPISCSDGTACTTDSCDPATGCKFTTITCADGNACTTDSCDPATGCQFTTISCADGNACTNDSCDPASGCKFTTISCNDGSVCTNDSCDPASGCKFTAITCNDGNACTSDACENASGCTFTPITCADGNLCTTDSCDVSIGCQFSSIICNDENACTDDSCNPSTGCSFAQVDCDDDNKCTTDLCDEEAGCINTVLVCTDDKVCTTDSCSPATGCIFTPIDCNDADSCTKDTCGEPNGCANTPITCNDENACTNDSCESQSGCKFAPVNCNDGNSCTSDSCDPSTGCKNTPVQCCPTVVINCEGIFNGGDGLVIDFLLSICLGSANEPGCAQSGRAVIDQSSPIPSSNKDPTQVPLQPTINCVNTTVSFDISSVLDEITFNNKVDIIGGKSQSTGLSYLGDGDALGFLFDDDSKRSTVIQLLPAPGDCDPGPGTLYCYEAIVMFEGGLVSQTGTMAFYCPLLDATE